MDFVRLSKQITMSIKPTFKSKAFAKAIKTKRVIERDMSLGALSEKIHVAKSTISDIENEKSVPDIYNYFAICRWLGVSMETFVNFKK